MLQTHSFVIDCLSLLFSDDLQNREHCWNTASLCDKNPTEGQHRSKESLAGGMAILRRVHRCLSSGAIPIPMTVATLDPEAEPTFYQSYSCDDLYLVSDLSPNRVVDSITQQPERLELDEQQHQQQPVAEVLHEIDPAQVVCTVCSVVSLDGISIRISRVTLRLSLPPPLGIENIPLESFPYFFIFFATFSSILLLLLVLGGREGKFFDHGLCSWS